ncbi:MAG: hypothetical protein LBJ12_01850 [Oscillospiraceae bacterium]|jgi:hypothetical protein|nr:hypothetical protein [Oscillospiraceae bacterium]
MVYREGAPIALRPSADIGLRQGGKGGVKILGGIPSGIVTGNINTCLFGLAGIGGPTGALHFVYHDRL